MKCGFSLNGKCLVGNMLKQSLIAQRVIQVHMLSKGYLLHDIPITRDWKKV